VVMAARRNLVLAAAGARLTSTQVRCPRSLERGGGLLLLLVPPPGAHLAVEGRWWWRAPAPGACRRRRWRPLLRWRESGGAVELEQPPPPPEPCSPPCRSPACARWREEADRRRSEREGRREREGASCSVCYRGVKGSVDEKRSVMLTGCWAGGPAWPERSDRGWKQAVYESSRTKMDLLVVQGRNWTLDDSSRM
jgi:hypothetical protein